MKSLKTTIQTNINPVGDPDRELYEIALVIIVTLLFLVSCKTSQPKVMPLEAFPAREVPKDIIICTEPL